MTFTKPKLRPLFTKKRFYALAATRAAIFREHVLIIETLPQHEADCCTLIQKYGTGLPIVLCSIPTTNGLQ